MTLNITVTTKRRIFQCADFRLTEFDSGKYRDFGANQKVQLMSRSTWHALICFFGVGRTSGFLVSDWLAHQLRSVGFSDTFDVLVKKLQEADLWLKSIPPHRRRHTFSIGAFVNSRPQYVLVTNCMDEAGNLAASGSDALRVISVWSKKPKTFVAPNREALSKETRQRLTSLASLNQAPDAMFTALAHANKVAAQHDESKFISPECFTMCINDAGDGWGRPHGMDVQSLSMPLGLPEELLSALPKHIRQGRMAQFVTARSEATEEFHEIRLRDHPNDPNTHSNYGAFLINVKKDPQRAERAFWKALEIDENHINALGNLAKLRSSGELYRKALALSPGHENVTWDYSRWLARKSDGIEEARKLIELGVAANPKSARLLLYRAELALISREASAALEGYKQAREAGADQTAVEVGYAQALHIGDAPIQEKINAYRTAIALRPDLADSHLNLAQLLFVFGIDDEAKVELARSMRLGLTDSAMLEAQFYLLAHTHAEAAEIVNTLRALLSRGARLDWNLDSNIDVVRETSAARADLLELLRRVLVGEADLDELDALVQQWT